MKILLIGARGQLGTDLQKTNPGLPLVALAHAEADITDAPHMKTLLELHEPDVVINAAAHNRTEDCETNPDPAFQVNSFGPQNLARACRGTRARLLTYSSDYVFDGRKTSPYIETDSPQPLNVYGLSKWGGECLALSEGDTHWVVRTASLYGIAGSQGKGGNFIEAVIQRAKSGQPVEVVDDIVMSPTTTHDLAVATWEMLQKRAPGGVYHITNSGACSWHQFAAKAFEFIGLPAPRAVHAKDRPNKMQRPAYSALTSERLLKVGVTPLTPWETGLRRYLLEKGHLPKGEPNVPVEN